MHDYDHDGSRELLASRPTHPDMLDVEDLTPGRVVHLRHCGSSSAGRYQVEGEPADGWVSMKFIDYRYGEPSVQPRSLADMGMVPYEPDGMWNPTNYVTADDDA